MIDANYWVKKLVLSPHPEGGFFKESYRSKNTIYNSSLPKNIEGNRVYSTAIYFLLVKGNFSAFHRIKSDEIWHFYDGDTIAIHIIDSKGVLSTKLLGVSTIKDVLPQITVPANTWFASETMGEYSLAGCTVAPGFDFIDFEMADREVLIDRYGEHKSIIEKFTR